MRLPATKGKTVKIPLPRIGLWRVFSLCLRMEGGFLSLKNGGDAKRIP